MKYLKNTVLPIFMVGIWINISEGLRWELLIKSYWNDFYQNLNLVFPNQTVNGIVWIVWGFLLAIIVFILSKKFNLLQTTLLSWFMVFVMLWLVLWNVDILPNGILLYVIPLSLIELFIGSLICKKLSPI